MRAYLVSVFAGIWLISRASAADVQEHTETYGPFGTVRIHQTVAHPSRVALFVSSDIRKPAVVELARSLAELDALVVVIDGDRYLGNLNALREKCSYPAAHFEGLSQYLQKKYEFAHYIKPVLIGDASGATLVYATLAQSPANTFAGGISLGFCPTLKTSKPFCKGSGALTGTPNANLGFLYQPAPTLPSPWVVLQGEEDRVCSVPDTRGFIAKVANAELTVLPKVGHEFSATENWLPQLQAALLRVSGSSPAVVVSKPTADSVKDLPLIELPLKTSARVAAIIVSGDGGWASLDKQVGEALNRDGTPVIGWDALQYFWKKKSPDIAAADLERTLTHYGSAWNIDRFILIGYSRGADTLPFMVSRLPQRYKAMVETVVLIGMDATVDFEFHVSDWLTSGGAGEHQVVPEVQKLAGMNVLCIYGDDEHDSGCRQLATSVTVVEMNGGHHLGGDYDKLAAIILQHSKR